MPSSRGQPRGLHLPWVSGCLYSPSRLEGVFSETGIQPGETLCNGTGGKRRFADVAPVLTNRLLRSHPLLSLRWAHPYHGTPRVERAGARLIIVFGIG
jgi:hypothetical protein